MARPTPDPRLLRAVSLGALLLLVSLPVGCRSPRDRYAASYDAQDRGAVGSNAYEFDDQYPEDAAPEDQVDFATFQTRLSPYGAWIETEEHGLVWKPRDVDPDWRPYTRGHWVQTEYGWTWISDWEWGWAPFHYGRWWMHPRHGWVWVWGSTWGPAWVAWRSDDDYIGWAPLPPQVVWQPRSGLVYTTAQLDVWVPVTAWCFVGVHYFTYPRLHTHIVLVDRHRTFFPRTRYSMSYVYQRGRIINRSIPVRRIETVTRRPVPRHRIRYVDRPRVSADRRATPPSRQAPPRTPPSRTPPSRTPPPRTPPSRTPPSRTPPSRTPPTRTPRTSEREVRVYRPQRTPPRSQPPRRSTRGDGRR